MTEKTVETPSGAENAKAIVQTAVELINKLAAADVTPEVRKRLYPVVYGIVLAMVAEEVPEGYIQLLELLLGPAGHPEPPVALTAVQLTPVMVPLYETLKARRLLDRAWADAELVVVAEPVFPVGA